MPLLLAQQHDRLIRRDLDAHPDQRQADHGSSVRSTVTLPPACAGRIRAFGRTARPRRPRASAATTRRGRPTATNGQVAVQIADVQPVPEHVLVGELDARGSRQVLRHDAPRAAGRAARTSRARAGPRPASWPIRYASVSPVSTMSSTSTTSRPLMSVSRSCRILTRPESGANREIDMKSTLDGDVGDRAGEVGEEDQRALQHADEHDAVGVVALRSRAPSRCTCAAIASASSRTVGGHVDGLS